MRTKQVGFGLTVSKPWQSQEELDEYKGQVLGDFQRMVAAHRLKQPDAVRWYIRPANPKDADPLGQVGSVGAKAQCETLPFYRGWVGTILARIYFWREGIHVG